MTLKNEYQVLYFCFPFFLSPVQRQTCVFSVLSYKEMCKMLFSFCTGWWGRWDLTDTKFTLLMTESNFNYVKTFYQLPLPSKCSIEYY